MKKHHEFVAQFDAGDAVPDWLLSFEETKPTDLPAPTVTFKQAVSVFEHGGDYYILDTDPDDATIHVSGNSPGEDREWSAIVPDGRSVFVIEGSTVLGAKAAGCAQHYDGESEEDEQ